MTIKHLAAATAALVLLAACAPASGPTTPPAADQAPAAGQFDATGAMPCSMGQPSYDQQCNWGVVRTDPGRAAMISVTAVDGSETMLNFADGEFSSPKGNVQYRPDGNGFWLVNVNDREFYRFAFEVITGG